MTREEAIKAFRGLSGVLLPREYYREAIQMAIEALSRSEIPNSSDSISRQAAIDALNGLIDTFEQILRDIREAEGDDCVCGMCEYDGAYIGPSGDWCNECPGFDKEDCFKLSDERRKKWLKELCLPSAQPEMVKCKECRHVYYDKEFDNYWCDRMSDPFKVEADGYCKWGYAGA